VKNSGLRPGKSPRNVKQVHNIQYQLNQQNAHDDVFETFLFGTTHDGVILQQELIPNLITIQSHPEVICHIKSLQETFKHLVFHYDTTFDVGDFFVSILSMRHPLFKNEPMIPVAAMFHDSTKQRCHSHFFKVISEYFVMNSTKVIIVTDREKGILNAIKEQLPNAQNLFCWNHIRRVSNF